MEGLRATDDASKAVQKTPNRVTLDHLLSLIVSEEYIYPSSLPHMTICLLITKNGFAFLGSAAPADPDNFDQDHGQELAKQDAVRQMWPMEGYLLRERLSKGG